MKTDTQHKRKPVSKWGEEAKAVPAWNAKFSIGDRLYEQCNGLAVSAYVSRMQTVFAIQKHKLAPQNS